MFNLLALGKKGSPHLFLSPFAGPELGYMIKKEDFKDLRKAYLGVTAGLQVKYKIQENFFIFVESRTSVIPYTNSEPRVTSLNTVNVRRSYYDNVFNFNFGIAFAIH